MRRLKDQEESIPIGCNITGLSIPGEHYRRRVILMSQFKAEAVGFELDMTGEQIEKRHKASQKKVNRNTISGKDAGSESSLNPQRRENRRMAARPRRSVSQNPASRKQR